VELKYSGNVKLTSTHNEREFLIDARFLPNNTQKPIILFVHGFKGFKDWGAFNMMADYFANAGFVFVKMNFSHNGTTVDQPYDFADLEAFGNNNFSIEQDDIQLVLDRLIASKLLDVTEADFESIQIIGHSRGGAASILTASQDKRIGKIATLAALNDLSSRYSEEVMTEWKKKGVYHIHNGRTKQEMPLYYQIVEDYLKNEDRLNVKQAIVNMEKPFLAIHGTEDETLPIAMLHEIKSWNSEVKTIAMNGANHTFGSTHPYASDELPRDMKMAIDHIIQFFKQGR